MGLRRRGPYAPARQQPAVDWAALERARDAVVAEQARVEEEARRAAQEFKGETDPVFQLVKRCHAIDLRQDAFEKRLEGLEEQMQTIINMLRED